MEASSTLLDPSKLKPYFCSVTALNAPSIHHALCLYLQVIRLVLSRSWAGQENLVSRVKFLPNNLPLFRLLDHLDLHLITRRPFRRSCPALNHRSFLQHLLRERLKRLLPLHQPLLSPAVSHLHRPRLLPVPNRVLHQAHRQAHRQAQARAQVQAPRQVSHQVLAHLVPLRLYRRPIQVLLLPCPLLVCHHTSQATIHPKLLPPRRAWSQVRSLLYPRHLNQVWFLPKIRPRRQA